MQRIALRYVGLACVLTALPLRICATQNEDATASRAPRFLLAMAERSTPVPVDLKRSAILRQPLSLALDDAPLKAALAGLVPCAESGTSTSVRASPRECW